MKKRQYVPDEVRRAAIAEYYAGEETAAAVAARYGISRSTFAGWVTKSRDDIPLTGGHWATCPRRRIQVWQTCFYDSITDCNINHQENRNAA